MSKIITFLLLTFGAYYAMAQKNSKETKINLSAHVDKRIELLSIVFRLAGNTEYNQDFNKSYVQSIHDHFNVYGNHEVITFAKELRQKNGISYDAVMSMAIQLEQPPALNPIIPFDIHVPEKRWTIDDASKFVILLQKFYKDANCEGFFKKHEELYKLAEQRFKSVTQAIDVNWYKKYYGVEPTGGYTVCIGLSNGGNNYGSTHYNA